MPKKFKPLSVVKSVVEKIDKSKNRSDNDEPHDNNQQLAAETTSDELPIWRQIKYIPKFLSKKEKYIIKAAILAIIISLGLMGYLFLKDNLVEKPKAGGTYSENIVGAPQYINPLYASINEADRDLVKLIYAGLIKFNGNQEIVPDLAREWFIDEKGTTYTFQLRNDVYWIDEKPFTAEDVVFTYEAIQNSKYESSIRDSWAGIKVEALDDYTVQFTLPEPFAPFLEGLTIGILPAHLWGGILPENAKLAELNLKPVGLGPYQFDSFTKDKQGFIKSYTLKKNEKYHLGSPYIDSITFKFQPTFELAVDSLKNRNADGINFLPLNLKDSLGTRKDIKYYSLSLPQYSAIFFNQDNNEILKTSKIRQALSLAIDKEKIVNNVLGGEAQAINGPILPGFPGYNPDKVVSPADIEKAKKILNDLGWKKKKINIQEQSETDEATTTEQNINSEVDSDGMSKFLFKDDKELKIKLTLADQSQAIAVAGIVQKFWQAIGVKTELNIVEAEQIQNDVLNSRNFEALLFGEILGASPDLFAFWHSSQAGEGGLNLSNFKDQDVDKLLEDFRKEESADKRAEDYIKLEATLTKEIPAIFLYNPNYTYAVSNKVKGIAATRIIFPSDRLNSIEKWYIKTKKGLK